MRRVAASITALVLASSLVAAPALADQPRLMTVTGQGEVSVAPDIAHVSLGVTAQADTAGEALSQMNAAARAVLDRLLTEEGLDSADVQTGQLSLNPRYSETRTYDAREIVGFTASTTVDVTLRDLTRLGGLLDAVVTDGANTLGGLQFDLSDKTTALDEARRAAVADARAKAELYADAAGVGLGDLVTLSEGGSSSPQNYGMMAMAEMRSVPIAEGALTISSSVTMVYELGGE